MARYSFCIVVLYLFLQVTSDEACFATVPVTGLATTRVTVRTSTTSTTTTTTTTTTTPITSCPSAEPLFLTGIPSPGDQVVQFIPAATAAATAAVGQTITVNCVNGNPAIAGTVVYVTFDSGVQAVQNTDDFPLPGFFFEQFFMTCTPSGLWDVSIVQTTGPINPSSTIVGPLSGIVSSPRSILCII